MACGREMKMYEMCIFFLSLWNSGKHGIQLFCDVLYYYFVIVLQESWDPIDHIDCGLFFSLHFPFSHPTGEIISVLSPSCMQEQRRLGSRLAAMNLGGL